MERKIVFLTFFLGLALFGCTKKENEIIEPKITNDNVEVTSTSASFTWMVDWVGKRISVVEVSEDVDMNDSQFYGSEEEINASSFSTTANDLKPATKYYYRFWVWNQNYANNRFVFEKKSFSTPTDLPVVKTLDVINITRTSATVQGEVISDGGAEITERGICWGTEHNPTITGNHISDEEGIGTYSFEITELIADETYYVRAYAKNKVGIAYGEEKSFTTGDAVLPTVTTSDITNISWTTAKGGGDVLLDGDAEVTERGVCWSTSHNPTISDNTVQSGLGIGEFVVNLSGLIAGTTYYVKAYAKNRIGISYGEEKSFTSANPELPTITTKSVTDITRTTAIGGGKVVSEGGAEILECGICWGMSTQPTIEGFHDVSEQGLDFSILMDNLNVEETYYVRAYAINSVGIAYGNVVSFTTSNADIPTVLTSYIADITSTTARGGGDVTDDGGANVTERGLCWGLFPNPTINDNHANNGTGLGSYVINMNELTPGTTYYVRAYAKNSAGVSYGNEVDFTTAQNVSAPTVTTSQVTNVAQTTATGGGNVTNSGGATVTERGICWSTSHNPTTSGSHANSGTGTGSFTVNMTGLTANTTYYVRAYAINSAGTSYGSEVPFTTLSSGGGHTYVDLGLPSGLLWATCNVGADSPEEYGDYFAWGETQPKSDYSWSTYQYCMGSSNK